VPEGIVMRYGQIKRNIRTLQAEGLIPDKIERVADVGYGSGAGSIAIADLFIEATITAIDNSSSQQNYPDYHRRPLPCWTSRFEAVSNDVKKVAPKLEHHDIVLASRIPFSDMNKKVDWRVDSLDAAETFIALTLLVKPETGVVLIGYEPHEDPGALWELEKRIDSGKLFNNLMRYQVENGDDWLVLKGVKRDALIASQSDPEILLTEIGKKLPPINSFAEYLRLDRSHD